MFEEIRQTEIMQATDNIEPQYLVAATLAGHIMPLLQTLAITPAIITLTH